MKKVLSLVFALLLLFGTTVCSFAEIRYGEAFVYDEADLLTASELRSLSERLSAISQSYNAQVTVVTVPSSDYDVDILVEDIFDDWFLGYGKNRDGVLLLVCMNPREYRILSNGFAADAITMEYIDEIGEDIVSNLSAGDYYDAFNTYADRCEYYLDGFVNGFPFDFAESLAVSVVIGVVIGLIVVFIMKAQLKSVRKKNHANVYVKSGSMHITRAGDYFLYRRVSKTPRQTKSSSSGGSSRNVGGGSF